MAQLNTLAALAAYPSQSDFLREQLGEGWVIAPRLSDNLVASGYRAAVTSKRYNKLCAQWRTGHPAWLAVCGADFGDCTHLIHQAVWRELGGTWDTTPAVYLAKAA